MTTCGALLYQSATGEAAERIGDGIDALVGKAKVTKEATRVEEGSNGTSMAWEGSEDHESPLP